jgi:hypothetical protein
VSEEKVKMSKNNQPSIVRRSTKGSVVSTTYEFPIRQKKTKTLQEIIYDSSEGTILGRTASSWGKIYQKIDSKFVRMITFVYLTLPLREVI